ncbi:FAD-dependent monooxygenase [Gordonia sp. X0973]|uniref:FAD-dependent monooxygenase n=1 Tax=Gordonia sp. X0973 TaxID=2742602 RepID=UPI000F51C815|nr:FAD-dependent monooxygenase [Gordonia sp. X0973]QKT05966.1 FAD-dependent monooxygenase [Gordonia sp. X0973]
MSGSSRPRAAVIGGGIGGLTTAIALRRRGWEVVVFEETENVAVGAGITLWANGLAALDAVGVGDAVRSASRDLTSVRILESTGRQLMRQTSAPGEIVALHRRDLNAALLAALPADVVRTSTSATVLDAGSGIVDADGTECHYDLVVAADGVHSATRLRWWPDAGGERDCGIRTWRTVIAGTHEALTVWGPAGECGILPLPDDTTYVFAASRGRARDEGLAYFDDWAAPVPASLAKAEVMITHDLTDLDPVRNPVMGRTVLIGDAAHAMRPHLGQGAGLAVEDAVVLAAHCSSSGGFDGAGFAAARRRRWATVGWLARRATTVMMPTNRFVGLAHRVMPLLPDRLLANEAGRVANWRP